MDKARIKYLYQHYLDRTATPQETREFRRVLKDRLHEPVLNELLEEDWNGITDQELESTVVPRYHEILQEITGYPAPELKTFKLWKRIAIAAAISFIGICIYFFIYNKQTISDRNLAAVQDIGPGKNGATLTLANGKKIRLTAALKGELANESGIMITKTSDGQLVYEVKGDSGRSPKINTLTTAKGESYMLTLPDKSKVWINAASSLTYSAALTKHGQRRVKLNGEAYFEISKDKAHPFVVETPGQEVEVLGTHFNVNAYADEPDTKTTLVEGAVKVMANGNSGILKPGQQSLLTRNGISIHEVDTELAIAWKDGLFVFNDEPLQNVMRRVARWYDVEVIYEGVDQNELYGGTVSRYDKVSKVLRKLELTGGIHFKIEGRTIRVMK